MAQFDIAILPGDGIGPEVMDEARKVLAAVERKFHHEFRYTEDLVGGAAIDKHKVALRPKTLDMCRAQDAVLFGAVGGPKWDNPRAKVRPEQAILGLRKGLGLFANIRPVKMYPFLADSTPLKREVVQHVDMVVLRELTGGIYFGKPQRRWTDSQGRKAVDTLKYSEGEMERIIRLGFDLARARRKKLTSVDKANILDSSRLWREIATEVSAEYPDVELEHLLVDACAMHLIRRPADFDVVATENMFGDILTDEASMLAGSMGMLPSASLGRRRADGTGLGLYEPIHGTAPDIAGRGIASPIAMILSAAMMLRLSLGLTAEADAVEAAVMRILLAGHRPPDIPVRGAKPVRTSRLGTLIADAV
jgi:3-isopropylmalate dehydrogenase